MKRIFSLVFISLYIYNIIGYLALFSALQYQVRSEVKNMLKAGVPEHELVKFSFHTPSLQNGFYGIQWIEENEFRHNGNMYDVVHMNTAHDTTYLFCVNDTQEKYLFENLDSHVQREMGGSAKPGKLDSFKDVFKDSYAQKCIDFNLLPRTGIQPELLADQYTSVDPDTPLLPPRHLF